MSMMKTGDGPYDYYIFSPIKKKPQLNSTERKDNMSAELKEAIRGWLLSHSPPVISIEDFFDVCYALSIIHSQDKKEKEQNKCKLN